MSNKADLKNYIDILKEQLDAGKKVSFVPGGNSMQPMLKNGENMIILEKPQGSLKLFDVALYYRKETDKYVVHRVVGREKDGSYIMLGDNNVQKEHNIQQSDIIGVLTAFYRKGKMYSTNHPIYKLYVKFWYYSRPVRTLLSMSGKSNKK